MDVQVFKSYIAVCEYGGFSAAAQVLGYSQSTVSSQIKQLETELDAVLFDRIRHNITITPEGEKVLNYAREMVSMYQQMVEELHHSEQITGTIRLAMAESVCAEYFTDDYIRFRREYPGITMKITPSGTEHMFEMLRKNEVDIVFTLDLHIYDPEFMILGESSEDCHFVVSAKNPLIPEDHISLKELVAYPFILTERNMSYRKPLDMRLASESLEIHPVLEIGDPHQICKIIEQSGGVSFLPDFVTRPYVEEGRLSYLKVDNCHIQVWKQILIHKNKWKSPAMDAFIRYYSKLIENR